MGLDSDLRISPLPVLVVLLALAIVLFLATQFLTLPHDVTDPVMTLLIVAGGLAAFGWLLTRWNGLLGRWFTIGALPPAVHRGTRPTHPTVAGRRLAKSGAPGAPHANAGGYREADYL